MQDSLKEKLNEAVKAKYPKMLSTACGNNELEVVLENINVVRRLEGLSDYKLSNAERRLRPSESPNVETIHKDNRPSEAIIGYRWKPEGSGQAPLIGRAEVPREPERVKHPVMKPEDDDDRLRELFKKIPKDNFTAMREVANALRNRSEYVKKSVLEYLEPLPCPANEEDPISRSKEDFIRGRHLDANNKRLFALKKELIQQQNALKKESRQRRDHVEWNYTPWAEQCALNEGVGYNPNYKQARLEDFSSRLEDAEDLIKSWEEGKFHDDFKTSSELDDYLRSTYIGCLPSRIIEDIESLKKRRPNLVHFLFGSKKKRGELYWRLVELYRFTANRKEIVRDDFQEISDAQECERFVNDMWGIDSPTSDSDSDIDKDLENKLKQFGLTKKQIIISMMRIDKMTISSIARELKISKRAVYKHLANIKQSLNVKESFPNDKMAPEA